MVKLQHKQFILLFLFIFSSSFLSLLPIHAENKEDIIKSYRSKHQSLSEKTKALRKKKEAKLRQVNALSSQIVENQKKLQSARHSLRHNKNRMSYTQQQIYYLKTDIKETIKETNQLSEDAGERLKLLYTGERLNHLKMILEARDVTTLLDRIYYKKRMVRHDKELLEHLRRKTTELRMQRENLQSQQTILDSTISKIEGYNTIVSSRIKQDSLLRQKYQKDANYYARAEQELLAESSSIQKQIQKLLGTGIKRSVQNSTGAFMWPLRGRITSPFGYRVHPIHKQRKMHTGLDIAARHGTPIKAADGGEVIYVGWRGGYGKVVQINHGNRGGVNLISLYAHMSSWSVSKGTTVRKGQIVGRVGSTGFATGPHLHFEIRENGKVINPKKYLK